MTLTPKEGSLEAELYPFGGVIGQVRIIRTTLHRRLPKGLFARSRAGWVRHQGEPSTAVVTSPTSRHPSSLVTPTATTVSWRCAAIEPQPNGTRLLVVVQDVVMSAPEHAFLADVKVSTAAVNQAFGCPQRPSDRPQFSLNHCKLRQLLDLSPLNQRLKVSVTIVFPVQIDDNSVAIHGLNTS